MMLPGKLGTMMKKAQEMQENMQKMQAELANRHIVGIEPLASLSTDEVADLIGPVLQHYITGSLQPGKIVEGEN